MLWSCNYASSHNKKKKKKTLLRNDSCMLGRQVCSCWGLTFHTCKTPLSKWERVSDEEDFVIMSSVTIGHGCDFPPQFYSLGRFKVTNRGDGSPTPSTNLDWCYDDISRIFQSVLFHCFIFKECICIIRFSSHFVCLSVCCCASQPIWVF